MNTLTIHTDGGARGNPGPAGIGITITIGDETKEYHEYLGERTNNQAEYEALIFSLQKAVELIKKDDLAIEEIVCYSDSELLVKQMKQEYKVKDADLGTLFVKAWNALQQLPKTEFIHVRREENKAADALVNKAIDEHVQ